MYRLLFLLLVFNFGSLMAQDADLYIRFNGRDKANLYRNHEITAENNQMVLDFSELSLRRQALEINLDKDIAPTSSFSVFLWLEATKYRNQNTTILTNRENSEGDGWELKTSINGSWVLNFHHKNKLAFSFNGSNTEQLINDGKMHLIGFAYDFIKNQVWLYYDGENVGIGNISDGNLSAFRKLLLGGPDSGERYSFDGYFKSFYYFDKMVNRSEAMALYSNYDGHKFGVNGTFYDKIRVLTWNIDDGGKTTGENIGVDRTLKVLIDSKADIIALQETNGSGEYLAEKLRYNYYSISENLSVLSRFPIEKTLKVFKEDKSGGALIAISKNQYLYFVNVGLSNDPDWSRFDSKNSNVYYRERELRSRGVEINEIMEQLDLTVRLRSKTALIVAGQFNTLSDDGQNKDDFFPLYNKIIEYGFTDTYRELFPNSRVYPGYTVPESSNSKRGRVDYIFAKGKKIQVSDSEVINHHPVKFPSGNYGVLTEFIWKR